MKTSTFKTMMIAGMMIMGTVTTFGKTNTNVHNNRNQNTRTEVVVGLRASSPEHQWSARTNHNHGMFDRHMRPGMDRRFFINHMMEGRHYFGHNHECKVCHLTRHQIHEVEKDMRHHHVAPHHTPAPVKPTHFRR